MLRTITAFMLMLFLFGILAGCSPVTIKNPKVEPWYPCSGVDCVKFSWDKIRGIDKLVFRTGDGQRLGRIDPERRHEFITPVVSTSWEYIKVKGCQDDHCRTDFWNIILSDNPLWTRPYFDENEPGFSVLGDEPWVDYSQTAPDSEGVDVYQIFRIVSGYRFNLPSDHFSSKTRTLRLRYIRTHTALDPDVVPTGMWVSAQGQHTVTRTWVPVDHDLQIPAPFHPSATTWYLHYDTPQKLYIGHAYGRPQPGRKPDWSVRHASLYPGIELLIKCERDL